MLEIAKVLGYEIVWKEINLKDNTPQYPKPNYSTMTMGKAYEISENFHNNNDNNSNQPDEEHYLMEQMQDRLDMENNFEIKVNKLLDKIINTYNPTIQDLYKEFLQTYSDNKNFPLSFKLTALYRVIYRLLSKQSDSGLRNFITELRNIYLNGDLIQLNDNELINLDKTLNYYLILLQDKQKD